MATSKSSLTMRTKLADVTNLQLPLGNENLPESSIGDKGRVEQLTRERMALIKLFNERNKIIEMSGAELQKLRVSVQKLLLQNWNLARSNSQMLAELNIKRDTVKTLQHELLCKEAVLKAKNYENQFKEADDVTLREADNDDKPRIGIKRRATRSQSLGASAKCQKVELCVTIQGKEDINYQTTGHELMEGEKPALMEAAKDEKSCVGNKRHATRSQSMGTYVTCQNTEQKDKVETKRQSLRKQSSRFKSDQEGLKENLFELQEAKFSENPMLEEQKDKVEHKRRSLRRQSSRFNSDEVEQTESLFEKEESKFPENPMPDEPKNKVENKRRNLRRQSSRLKSDEEEQTETLFEIAETKFPENPMLKDDLVPFISSTKQEDNQDSRTAKSEAASQKSSIGRKLLPKAVKKDIKILDNLIPTSDPTPLSTNKENEEISSLRREGASQRCSVGRPMRRAAEKVQSYKEPPLHLKMRRAE